MENNNNLDNEKQDMIDRKISGVVKIFGLAERDFMALMLTLSLLLNIVQYYDVRNTEKELHNQIVEEVRRQAVPAIKLETKNQLEPLKNKIDTTVSNLNKVINNNNE